MTVRKTLCGLEEIPDGGARSVELPQDGYTRSVLLLRRQHEVTAFENECPHAARRFEWAPGRFLIEDGYLICPAHGAMFTIPSGACVSGPCRGQALLKIEVAVEADGEVVMTA